MIRTLALLLALSPLAARADEEIPLDKAPPGAVKAVKAKYPSGTIKKVEKEDDDGKVVIEFTLHDGKKMIEAEFTPEGKFVKSEEVVGELDVPKAVMAAFRTKYPNAAPTKMERVTKGDGSDAKVMYEFDIQDGGKECEVFFATDGAFIEKKEPKPAKPVKK